MDEPKKHCNRCHKPQPYTAGHDSDGNYAEYCRRCEARVFSTLDYGRGK